MRRRIRQAEFLSPGQLCWKTKKLQRATAVRENADSDTIYDQSQWSTERVSKEMEMQ